MMASPALGVEPSGNQGAAGRWNTRDEVEDTARSGPYNHDPAVIQAFWMPAPTRRQTTGTT